MMRHVLARPALLWCLLVGCLLAPAAGAEQVSFSKDASKAAGGGAVVLSYRFRDAGGISRSLVLPLANDRLQAAYQGLQDYQPEEVNREIAAAVEAYAAPYRGALTIETSRREERLNYVIRSRSPALVEQAKAELPALIERTRARALADRFMVPDGEAAVRYDYARLAARYVADMGELARRLDSEGSRGEGGKASARDRVALALAFIQGIPYDTVEDNRRAYHFVPPPVLLAHNKGDCDSKSVALASLLGVLTPELSTAVILLPKHALLGVTLPPLAGDRTIRHRDREYVLLEPVGPAISPIGRIARSSALAMTAVRDIQVLPVPR